MDTAKICKKCGRELPLDKFGINHNYTRSMCKECFNEEMREKRYQQRLSDGIETYHKDKSMKIQRKYKKPYHFQILYRSESGIDTIAKDEVFVRLFDYKSVWTSNYGRIIQKMDDGTYQLVKGVYSRTTKELTYTLDRNVYFKSKNRWGYRKEKVTASDLVIKMFVVNYDMKNNTMVWHKNNDTKQVCIKWQNYQNFKIWFDTHYIPGTKVDLEKDLLYKEGNIYSPETCAFMTHFLNTVFEDRGIESNIQQNDDGTYSVSMNVLNKKMDIGVFDSEEEAHSGFIDGKIDYICDLAEKCKGKVPDYVYEGMLNYKIEID